MANNANGHLIDDSGNVAIDFVFIGRIIFTISTLNHV